MSITVLDLREARFIPPAADKYIDAIFNYWGYAMYCERRGDFFPPDVPADVEEAEEWLKANHPELIPAVETAVIRMLMKE